MFNKSIVKKLFIFLILLIFPFIVDAYNKKVYVGGENIGINVKSDGVLIVGFYKVGNNEPGKDAGLKVGDRIIKIDDISINDVDHLSKEINAKKSIKITYKRNLKEYETELKLVKDKNNSYKTGLYIKDNIVGIGTLTFIDPDTKMYGAFGHEILEKKTNKIFDISDGFIFKSIITGIEKSAKNNPGEKHATFISKVVYGDVLKNTKKGIFGNYSASTKNKKLVEVASFDEIKEGNAYLRTVIDGENIEEFQINIIRLNKKGTKNILFEINDPKLLKKTNGIIQGMSGSPILQNNKIIGAVTHVVIDDPIKGYGIYMSNMLEEIEN